MPNTVTHPNPEVLSAFAQGKLPEAAAGAITRHLEACPACRKTLEALPPASSASKVRAAKPGSSAPASSRGLTRVAGAPGASAAPKDAAAPSGSPQDLPPELANHPKYRIVRELGRGGMGVVYQAVHTQMDRTVALKVINPGVLQHADALPRFQAEVKAAARLDHPNIVRAYDADRVGNLHLLVMEFVEGMNLFDMVNQKGPLSVAHACHFVRQAALGLQHAFEQGMVHRDIKPHNLMLAPRGQVKILDFGLARLRDQGAQGGGLTTVGSFMGTPEYISPEQATDARTADTRADLYSLGCTLYFLLAGRPPFQEDTTVKLVLAQIEKEAPALHAVRPDVPVALSAVVARLLAKDPGRRYQKPVEVAQALVPFIKPGTKGDTNVVLTSAPGVASPGKGTVISSDTSKSTGLPKAGAGKAPAKGASEKDAVLDLFEGMTPPISPSRISSKSHKAKKPVPVAWYRRRAVLSGVGAAVLAFVLGAWLLAGVIFKAKVRTADGEAFVVLEVDQADAEVLVDGQKVTVTMPGDNQPFEIKAEPGRHQLRISKDGFEAITRDIELKTGKSAPIKVRLEPIQIAAAKPADQPAILIDPETIGNSVVPPQVIADKPAEELVKPRVPQPPGDFVVPPQVAADKPVVVPVKSSGPAPKPAPSKSESAEIPSRLDDSADQYATVIKKDKEVYEAAMKRAGDRLLAAFDRAVEALPNAKINAEERIKLIDVVKAEKATFENKGRIPWSAPLRIAVQEYLRASAENRFKLSHSFDNAIDFHLKRKNEERAKEYLSEKREILKPKILAVWNYSWLPGRTNPWEFDSDGTIGGGPGIWSLDKDLVIMIGPDPHLKGGHWIDTCKTARDGKTMSGKNQLGNVKSAKLIEVNE